MDQVGFQVGAGATFRFPDGRRLRVVGKCGDTGDIVFDWLNELGRRVERDVLPLVTLAGMQPRREEDSFALA